MTRTELIAAVKRYATDHYNQGGWDYVVEAYSDAELDEAIGKASTLRGAIWKLRKQVGIRDEVRRDIQAA